MIESYFLSHITTKDRIESIKKEGFKKSVHTSKTSQWLGDGVYFWDGNDKASIMLGKMMVKKKKGNFLKEIQRISRIIKVDEDFHLNLDDMQCGNQFKEFLQNCPNENIRGQKLLDMLEQYKNKNNLAKKEKKKLGRIFGFCMNAYIKIIESQNKKVDMISYSFYGGQKKKPLYSNEELNSRQFCIKNLDLLNKEEIKDDEIDII